MECKHKNSGNCLACYNDNMQKETQEDWKGGLTKDVIKTFTDVAYEQGRIVGQKEASYILSIALKKLGGELKIFDYETLEKLPTILATREYGDMTTNYYLKEHDN